MWGRVACGGTAPPAGTRGGGGGARGAPRAPSGWAGVWGGAGGVYRGRVEPRVGQVSGMEGPEEFLGRGRLWKVRAVLAHWVETGPWWQAAGARTAVGSEDAAAETTERGPTPIGDL